MPDVRAVQETIQFQADSSATVVVDVDNDDGTPADVTDVTMVVALIGGGTITPPATDPEAGKRSFAFTAADTTSIQTSGGLYRIANGDEAWFVGTVRASTEGTRAQDHTLTATVGSAAQFNATLAAYIGGGVSGPSGSLPIAARVATPVSNLGGSVGSGVATIPPFAAMSAGQLAWLTAQASGADDGFYVHGSGGVFTVTTDYIDAAYLGWIIAVGTDLDTGTATAYVVRNDGSGIVAERVSLTPAQLTAALAPYATTADLGAKVDAADLGTSAFLDVGTAAGEVAAGDDARFTDDRDPNAHAASHANGGADEVALDASQITTGTMDHSRLPAIPGFGPSGCFHSIPGAIVGSVARDLAVGRVYASPYPVRSPVSLDAMRVNVVAAIAGDWELLLFDDTGAGYPGNVLASSTISMAATGIITGTFTPVALTPGLYWVGVHDLSAATATVSGIMREINLAPVPALNPTTGSGSAYFAVPGTSPLTAFPAYVSPSGGGQFGAHIQVRVA